MAEVLITLAIIGVVAAIVMPSVIASYQLKTVGVKLAKFAGTIENSARAFTASNGAFPHATMTEVAGEQTLGSSANLINEFLADSLVIKDLYETDINYSSDNYAGLVVDKTKRDDDANRLGVAKVTSTGGTNPTITTTGDIAVLKDNTRVMVYPISEDDQADQWDGVNGGSINKANVGDGAFIIAFDPAVNGLPGAKKKIYYFVVTETGFVFPAAQDDCTWDIFNNDWNSTSTIMDKDKHAEDGQGLGTGYSCTRPTTTTP